MLLIDDYIFKIRVDKEPGLYGFEPMSATGKTYLCKICKRLNGYGKKLRDMIYTTIEEKRNYQ